MKLTATQIAEAKKCKSPEEVVEKAKERGIEITLEEAQEVLLSPEIIELEEDDLATVAGGGSCNGTPTYQNVTCGLCGGTARYYHSDNGYHYYACNATKLHEYDYEHITVYKGSEYHNAYFAEDD